MGYFRKQKELIQNFAFVFVYIHIKLYYHMYSYIQQDVILLKYIIHLIFNWQTFSLKKKSKILAFTIYTS